MLERDERVFMSVRLFIVCAGYGQVPTLDEYSRFLRPSTSLPKALVTLIIALTVSEYRSVDLITMDASGIFLPLSLTFLWTAL